MHNRLRSNLSQLSKNKLIQARVLDVIGNRCGVQLASNGRKLLGIPFIGGPLQVGDIVYINYASGQPVAESRGQRYVPPKEKKKTVPIPIPDYSQTDLGGSDPPPNAIPTAPSNLLVSAVGSQIDLNWVDNSNNEDGFQIERSTDGTNFVQIIAVGADVTTYSDTGLNSGATYYYRVRAYNSYGSSSYTATANATTTAVDIVRVGFSSVESTVAGTSGVVSVPAGTENDDVMVVVVSFRIDGNAPTAPAGWTLIRNDTYVSGSDDLHCYAYQRIASNEPADYTWTFSNATNFTIYIVTYRYVDTSPVDTSASTPGTSTTCTGPSVTPSNDNSMILFVGAAAGVPTYTPPSGYTEVLDIKSTDGATNVSSTLAELLQPNAAATGDVTATLSASANNIGMQIVLRPSGGGGVSTPPPSSSSNVPLSWFYIKPSDGSTASSMGASRFSTLILDHKSDRLTFLSDMKNAGFAGLPLHYFIFDYTQAPNASFYPRVSFWDYKSTDWTTINATESMFLHSGTPATSANRVAGSNTGEWYMDPGSTAWINFVVARAQEIEALSPSRWGFAGFFLDNVQLSWNKPRGAAGGTLYDGNGNLIASSSAYRTRVIAHLQALKNGITGQLWGNMIEGTNDGSDWNSYMAYMDGGMKEDLSGWQGSSYHSHSNMSGILTQLEWVTAQNKGWIAVAQGNQSDSQKQLYSLACYLLVVPQGFGPASTPVSSFRYSDYAFYQSWWNYSNYDLSTLGSPLGPREARIDGVQGWKRYFTGGYVQINTSSHVGQIVLN